MIFFDDMLVFYCPTGEIGIKDLFRSFPCKIQQSERHALGGSAPTVNSYVSKFNSNDVHINKRVEISKRETVDTFILKKSSTFSTGLVRNKEWNTSDL